jgi:WD40 repeat protein
MSNVVMMAAFVGEGNLAKARRSREESDHPATPDVFVSYAREDQAFVRKLLDALQRHGRHPWVDWEGIPPSAEWWREIEQAIESSHSVVYILTPASLASASCTKEVEHAVRNNKRLIPICREEVPEGAASPAVSALNWVFFRDTDDFDASVTTLLSALDTDLEWVHEHTRLLVRANEWEAADHDAGYLIRGRDLEYAEGWLAKAPKLKDVRPTEAQTTFIHESRRRATRKQRGAISAVALALVMTLLLATIALLQRGQAIASRNLAEQQARVALSRQLAIESESLVDTRFDLAALLSIEAERTSPTNEALSSMLTSVARTTSLKGYLRGPGDEVRGVAFTRDGSTIVSADKSGQLISWSAESRQTTSVLDTSDTLFGVAAAPDGSQIAAGGANAAGSGEVVLWDTGVTRDVLRFPTRDFVESVAISPDGKTLAAGLAHGSVERWDIASGRSFPPLDAGDFVANISFSADGRLLAAGTAGESLTVWDTASGRALHLLHAPTDARALVFAPKGDVLAVASGSQVITYNLSGQRSAGTGASMSPEVVSAPIRAFATLIQTLAFADDGSTIAVGTFDGSVALLDAASLAIVQAPFQSQLGTVWGLAFSPDGRTLGSAGADGTVALWDLSGAGLVKELGSGSLAYSVAVSPDGHLVATGTRDGRVLFWDPATDRQVNPPIAVGAGEVPSVTFSPDGTLLAAGTKLGRVLVFEVASERPVTDPITTSTNVNSVSLSSDDRSVAWVTLNGEVALRDFVGGSTFVIESNVIPYTIAFSPDGSTLAWGGADHKLHLVSVATQTETASLPAGSSSVTALAFSPDSKRIAVGTLDGSVRVWSVESHQLFFSPVRLSSYTIRSIAFGADGGTIATGSADQSVIFLDAGIGFELGQPLQQANTGSILGVSFGPPGTFLAAVSSRDGVVRLWSSILWSRDAATVGSRLCSIVGRNLTTDEWNHFLPGSPYHQTCPAHR